MAFFSAFLSAGLAVMLLLLFLGAAVLQVILCKKENPWAGLVLPGVNFCLLLYIAALAPDFSTAWPVLVLGNIATVIDLLIYYFVRRRKKKQDHDRE